MDEGANSSLADEVQNNFVENDNWILEAQAASNNRKGRRKSWHALKFDRKRRKELQEHGSFPELRRKRHSWWNIFANQQISRSKSVDHGLLNPFSLEGLHIKEQAEEKDGELPTVRESKKEPPDPTITYIVSDRDTLTSVAARFDTTPSELTKLNRLATPYIFPGQKLQVPDRTKKEDNDVSDEKKTPIPTLYEDLPSEEKELLENLRPVSPKPGHVERIRTPSVAGFGSGSTDSAVASGSLSDSSPFTARFLKINVRHITDGQGVVGGVLLVTPNAVMFDPNVSDTLVIEHGPEAYGVIAPMEFVVNVAIYYDIAHMRTGQHGVRSQDQNMQYEKPEIYHGKSSMNEKSIGDDHEPDSLMVKDETFPELVLDVTVAGDDAESVCSSAEREGDAFPKAFERELVTPVNIESGDNKYSVEDRRKSLLDHHWAVPSKDRESMDVEEISEPLTPSYQELKENEKESLTKESCHDSGIDVHDFTPIPSAPPLPPSPSPPIVPPIQPIPVKTKYSDADIILSNDWVPALPLPASHVLGSSDTESPARKKTSSVSFSLDSNTDTSETTDVTTTQKEKKKETLSERETGEQNRKNKMLKRLSYPLSWMETFSTDKDQEKSSQQQPHSADSQHTSVFSKVFSRRSSVGTFIRQPTESSKPSKSLQPKLDYRSMVSVEDMPELFVSFDKLIPTPARSCEDPPLYLRLRMGKPLDKPIPKSTPLMSYGKKKMRPEYWFSVPRNRVDDLYNFIQAWFPQLYGEIDEEEIKSRGFMLIENETELWSPDSTPSTSRHGSQGDVPEFTKESWEVRYRFYYIITKLV
ncbi:oxidation resistance protein 1 isoform X2 [Agrilus planipennis]|uniref:Oxidation resistance protein 1 isoform X2 n=1 Tax=Agrilus planipennis TaxID=224129 RepID=A0A7F5RCH0_AGRPL|nr:oxidation resistance protein 1 isoform X2 [Agrilus planipennis]